MTIKCENCQIFKLIILDILGAIWSISAPGYSKFNIFEFFFEIVTSYRQTCHVWTHHATFELVVIVPANFPIFRFVGTQQFLVDFLRQNYRSSHHRILVLLLILIHLYCAVKFALVHRTPSINLWLFFEEFFAWNEIKWCVDLVAFLIRLLPPDQIYVNLAQSRIYLLKSKHKSQLIQIDLRACLGRHFLNVRFVIDFGHIVNRLEGKGGNKKTCAENTQCRTPQTVKLSLPFERKLDRFSENVKFT